MSRFDDPVGLPREPISPKEARSLAQTRAYDRWQVELFRKYRSQLNEPHETADQDYTNLEHLATREDMQRLNELLKEELSAYGQS